MSDAVKDFDKAMLKVAEIYREEILSGLKYIGNECIRRIRELGRPNDWTDQTSNLRSSVGFAVYEYGKTWFESAFEPIKPTGWPGHFKGLDVVDELAKQYSETFALVIVAGMDYAEYVEKKRDVLASTELWAKAYIEQALGTFMKKAEIRAQAILDHL